MEINKALVGFVLKIIDMKSTLLTAADKSTYESKGGAYKFSIHDTFETPNCHLRNHKIQPYIQIRKSLLEMSDMSIFFWCVWGLLRNSVESNEQADVEAFNYLCKVYTNAKRKDYSAWYEEFNGNLSLVPSEKNLQRGHDMFNRVTDMFMSSVMSEQR